MLRIPSSRGLHTESTCPWPRHSAKSSLSYFFRATASPVGPHNASPISAVNKYAQIHEAALEAVGSVGQPHRLQRLNTLPLTFPTTVGTLTVKIVSESSSVLLSRRLQASTRNSFELVEPSNHQNHSLPDKMAAPRKLPDWTDKTPNNDVIDPNLRTEQAEETLREASTADPVS